MTKSDLVERVSEQLDIPKVKAESAINGVLDAIETALCDGDKVTLVGFGTFSTYERPSRNGRNPKTGEQISIDAKKVVKFKAGTRLLNEMK